MNIQNLIFYTLKRQSTIFMLFIILICILAVRHFSPEYALLLFALIMILFALVLAFTLYKVYKAVKLAFKAGYGNLTLTETKGVYGRSTLKNTAKAFGVDIRGALRTALEPALISNDVAASSSIIRTRQRYIKMGRSIQQSYQSFIEVQAIVQNGES